MTVQILVYGTPAPQGSKRIIGHGRMVESSRRVAPWREDVKQAALGVVEAPIDRPVKVDIAFRLRRPAGHFGTGRNAGIVKASAPAHPTSRQVGDIDKLARSTLDALVTAGVIADDSLVADLRATKKWVAGKQLAGATITIVELPRTQGDL